MKTSFIRIVISLFVVSMAFNPLKGVAQTAIDSVSYKISEAAIKEIRRNPDQAIQTLMTFAFSCNDDGIVTEECYKTVSSIRAAELRAREAQALLVMDLNADGSVSKDEFKTYNRTKEPRRQSQNTLAFLMADTNEDDVLSIGEILQFAEKQYSKRGVGISGRVVDEIMSMDIDGDGKVTTRELVDVVKAVSG